MATLYLRGNRWWLSWGSGEDRMQKPLRLLADEKEKALDAKFKLERELAARENISVTGKPSKMFVGYRKHWIAARKTRGLASAKDDEARLKHARELDALAMSDIKPRHIRDVILGLRSEGELAPRTIRHVFGLLHRLFNDAIFEEVVTMNPCVLPRGVLPGKQDKDPTWRSRAVFQRGEAERLISDPEIPEAQRTLYTLLFLSGLRIGEAAALRWSSYDSEAQPLGRLDVAASFSRKQKRVKGVKGGGGREDGNPRLVPVHPTLASALASWRVGGWARHMGRMPKADDLLIPTSVGTHLKDEVVLESLKLTLKKLGLRPRRTHDTRRTFVTLLRADGGREDIVKLISHGPGDGIIDLYTTMPWETLCTEMSKLNVRSISAATILLHPAASKRNV